MMKHHIAGPGTGVHFLHLRRIYAGRFFAERVDAVAHCQHRQTRMLVVRRCDNHRVDKPALKHLLRIAEKGEGADQLANWPMLSGALSQTAASMRH